tara:strand:+ start:375 stop:1067 length:693 start_codon:yes stop_codon:yes gene_type:complete
MASRAEYMQMMKRLEKDSMGEERVPASLNMGLDSLMPNMGRGSVSNREMNPTGNDMVPMMPNITDPKLRGLNIPPISKEDMLRMLGTAKGSRSDKELEMISRGAGDSVSDFEKALKDKAAGGFMARMGGAMTDKEFKLLEDAMGGSVTDEIREAISALMGMGFGMTDAIEALGDEITNPATMTEGAISDKEMGALNRLPQGSGEGAASDYERSLGKDTTYSADFEDQINT